MGKTISDTLQPYLLAAVLCASPIKSIGWQPFSPSSHKVGLDSLSITTGTGALYQWTLQPDPGQSTFHQIAEGIPVPEGMCALRLLCCQPGSPKTSGADLFVLRECVQGAWTMCSGLRTGNSAS